MCVHTFKAFDGGVGKVVCGGGRKCELTMPNGTAQRLVHPTRLSFAVVRPPGLINHRRGNVRCHKSLKIQ